MTQAVTRGEKVGMVSRMASPLLIRRLTLHILFHNWIPIFYLFALHTPVEAQTQLGPGTYGDRCSVTNPCEKNANLVCINNFCQCSGSDEVFDDLRERCAVQEGKRCSPPKYNYGEFNPCVANAHCSPEKKVCVCAKHTFPDEKGHCLKKRFFNGTCTMDRHCDDMKYLSCIDGLCQCEKTTLLDDYYQICKRRIGDFCLRSRDCVRNAECVNARCTCKDRYVENSDKTCALSFGQRCGGSLDDSPCSDTYFACINGICQYKSYFYNQQFIMSKIKISLS